MARAILVVDDAAFIRALLRAVLTKAGFTVHEAISGQDALARYEQLGPDLVTLDLSMPDMSGMEVLEQLRAADPDVRVLVISAIEERDAILEALSSGAVDFLPKPFEPSQVLAAVGRCMQPASDEQGSPSV